MEPTAVDKSRLATPHPTGELLESYALGRLSEPALGQVETHLFVCHACQDALLETDKYNAAMKAALAEPQPVFAAATWPTRLAAFGGQLVDSLRLSHPVPVFSAALAALSLAVILSQSYKPETGRDAEITLISVRGGVSATQAQGPADARLTLRIQSPQLSAGQDFQARIVDAAGKPAWAGTSQSRGEDGYALRVDTPLPAGTYWVRLYDSKQKLLQEYGLALQ
jgi:hypothetical protein